MDKPIEVYDEEDLCEFELRRQRNILANRDFMIQCGLPVRPLIFLKKQKISLEELYGYASSDEESVVNDDEVPPAEESVDGHDGDVPNSIEVSAEDAIEARRAGNSSVDSETSNEEAPRSILIDNAPLSPNSEPFFRGDELQEVQEVLSEFFSESHTPSYIINMTRDTDVDPNDGAIAGPSGLCQKRSHNDADSISSKSRARLDDCQVHDLVPCDYEAEVTSDSRGKQPLKRKKNVRLAPSKKCKLSPAKRISPQHINTTSAVDNAQTTDTSEERRYPRRSIPRLNYREEEDLPHDSEIMCDKCGIMYNGDCPIHNNLLPIGDSGSPLSSPRIISSDTLPNCVRLGGSRISGQGVFTNYRIHEGTIFGPYKGKDQDGSIDKSKVDTSYFWAIRNAAGHITHYKDGRDPKTSNWMRS